MAYTNYAEFIQDNLHVLDKKTQQFIPFVLNPIQQHFVEHATGRDIVLKARQQGFSSLTLGIFTADFLLRENSLSVVIADITDNALDLLGRVKNYIESYEEINKTKVELKYNSKYELHNKLNNARYIIGTAENANFGRSKTITNLHLSEAAFYKKLKDILASAGTALVPNGKMIIETTANGFNEFKDFWDESNIQHTGFNPMFYKASDFYDANFLAGEKLRLGNLYPQEYPETPEEAFLNSGDLFFDRDALQWYIQQAQERESYVAALSQAI